MMSGVSYPKKPLRFKRSCCLCGDPIRKELTYSDRDPGELATLEERQAVLGPYFRQVGHYTSLDPDHKFPLCEQCKDQVVSYLDCELPPHMAAIEYRTYHGRTTRGRHEFICYAVANRTRQPGRRLHLTSSLVAAMAYKWLLSRADLVWADGCWQYGHGYTNSFLKPRSEAKYHGMNLEDPVAHDAA